MRLVFLYGPAGVGKLTVGKCLQAETGFRLFHNHVVVDALLAVFPFGSDPFNRLREQFWLSVFEEAAAADISIIFTFAPERTVRRTFVAAAAEAIRRYSGSIHFVELVCDIEEIERRIEEPSRRRFDKLHSIHLKRQLESGGAFEFPKIARDLVLDTTELLPEKSAHRISRFFGLTRV